jgi:uncharacterized RmlC-like cupin family protein
MSNVDELITIRPESGETSLHKLTYFLGISGKSAGAKGLSMNLVVIPPNAAATPHIHQNFEAAIYVLEGEIETRYGENLSKSCINRAGDFLYIPPGVPHSPRNLSQTQAARAIVARNDPDEQENTVPYNY